MRSREGSVLKKRGRKGGMQTEPFLSLVEKDSFVCLRMFVKVTLAHIEIVSGLCLVPHICIYRYPAVIPGRSGRISIIWPIKKKKKKASLFIYIL